MVEKAFTQAELDQKINDRLARERKKYSDYDEIKSKAAQLDEIEQANATELEKAVAAAQKLTREQVLRESAEVAAKFAVKAQLETRIGKDAAADLLEDINIARYVGDDGSIDEGAITSLADRIAPVRRFQGGADGGARDEKQGATLQAQIADAQRRGDAAAVINLNNQLLAQQAQAQ